MTRSMLRALLLLLGASLASASWASDRLSADYPEGPLIVGETVLFADMREDAVVAWTGEGRRTFYDSEGCGPTALAPYGDGYAVLCHRADEIHAVSREGHFIGRFRKDTDGRTFDNPNDASADADGGVYFSASGPFRNTRRRPGALLYLDADGRVHRLVERLNYPNGVHFDRKTRRLYVSEHLAGRVLVFRELAPGRLGSREVFKDLAGEQIAPIGNYPLMGPDGLDTDSRGNLYVAIYGAGLLVILSRGDPVLHRLPVEKPLLTNVAVSEDDRTLVLTGTEIAPRGSSAGLVQILANPLYVE